MKTVDQQKLDIIRSHINAYRGNLEIDKQTRNRLIVQARQEIHYFAKKHTKLTLEYIGQQVGGLAHCSVLYSDKIVKDKMSIYASYRNEINQLEFGLKLKYSRFASLKEEKMKRLMKAASKHLEKDDTIELCMLRGTVKIVYHIDSNYLRLDEHEHQIIEAGDHTEVY